MKIYRRGYLGVEYKGFLETHDIKHEAWPPDSKSGVKEIDSYMFEITENNPVWPKIETFLKGDHTYVRTHFTDEERLDAEWCLVWGHHLIVSYRIPKGRLE